MIFWNSSENEVNIMHSTPSVMNSAARRYSLTYTEYSPEDSKQKFKLMNFVVQDLNFVLRGRDFLELI